MLEFKRRTLKLKFEGTEVELKFPTALELDQYRKDTVEGAELEITLKFLEKLGLPEDIGTQLEVAHLTKIVEALADSKKS